MLTGASRFYRTVPGLILLAMFLSAGNMPVMAEDTEIGRLFTTVKERKALDKLRHKKVVKVRVAAKEVVVEEEEEEEARPKLTPFQFDGMVSRQGGPNTAWVDGQKMLHKGKNAEGVEFDPEASRPGALVVKLPDSHGGTVKVSAGDGYDPERGEILDALRPVEKNTDEQKAPSAPGADELPPELLE